MFSGEHFLLNPITVQQDATFTLIINRQMHLYNFTQKHLKLLRQVSILRSSSGSYVFFLAKVTTVIPASGIDQPDLLPSALVVELELIHVYRTVGTYLTIGTDSCVS